MENNKKVFASFKNYKKKMYKSFIVFLIIVLLLTIGLAALEPIAGLIFIIPDLLIVFIISRIKKIPNDIFLYDEENKELILYGKGSLFTASKPIVIKTDDISSIGYNVDNPIDKRKGYEQFVIRTQDKMHIFKLIDDFKVAYNNIMNVLPDEFYLQKYIHEENIDKVLTFSDNSFFVGLHEILYKKMYRSNLTEEQFDIYIFTYFIYCLFNGGLHYYALFFKKYLTNIIKIYEKLNLEDSIIALNKLHYLYPNSTGKEFYDDYFEMYSNKEEFMNLEQKLKEIIETLGDDFNKNKGFNLLKNYILENNIKL